jgi:hypothetical protein
MIGEKITSGYKLYSKLDDLKKKKNIETLLLSKKKNIHVSSKFIWIFKDIDRYMLPTTVLLSCYGHHCLLAQGKLHFNYRFKKK